MGGANRPIAANRFGKPHSLGQFVDSGRPTTAFRLHHYFVQLAGLDQMSQRPVDITPAFDVFLERPFYISPGHFAPAISNPSDHFGTHLSELQGNDHMLRDTSAEGFC